MVQQHLYRRCDLHTRKIIDRVEHPKGLRQDKVRYPGSLADGGFRSMNLVGSITREEPNKDVRINCEHVVVAWLRECRPLRPARSCPSARLAEIARRSGLEQ